MIDDQTVLAKVMDVMGLAVAVIGLFFSFVGDRQGAKDGSSFRFDSLVMFLSQVSGKGVDSLGPRFQDHDIIASESAHIRYLERLVEKSAKGGLSIPVVKRDRELDLRMSLDEFSQKLLSKKQLALIKLLHLRLMLMTPPKPQQILAPLIGGAGFEVIFA